MSSSPIAVLGAGNMASALALHLARLKQPVRLYCIEQDVHEEMLHDRCNSKYLAGHRFPNNVTTSPNLATVLTGATSIWIAVPSFAVGPLLQQVIPHLTPDTLLISLSKGLDATTGMPLIEREAQMLPKRFQTACCTIGGPAIANEMAKGSPTAFVIAGRNKRATQTAAHMLQTDTVKAETSTDRIGVGLCSALKNVYAIGLGLCDGLQYPTNAKALLLTLAIEELATLVEKSGGRRETAFGLAGLGDLMVSGMSLHGRNRTYGERLAAATTNDPQALGLGTVEGIAAAHAARPLLKRLRKRAPLLEAILDVLAAKKNFVRPFESYMKELRLS